MMMVLIMIKEISVGDALDLEMLQFPVEIPISPEAKNLIQR